MPIPKDYERIVVSMRDLTTKKKIAWKTGPNATILLASLKGLSIKLTRKAVMIGIDVSLEFSLLDSEGDTIDSFTVISGTSGFSIMAEIWESARRQALGVDTKVSDLERSLEELEGDLTLN